MTAWVVKTRIAGRRAEVEADEVYHENNFPSHNPREIYPARSPTTPSQLLTSTTKRNPHPPPHQCRCKLTNTNNTKPTID